MGRFNWVHTLPLARDFLNHGLLKNCNHLLNQHSKEEKMKVPLNIFGEYKDHSEWHDNEK